MWAKRSHLLQPLTVLTSNKVKFKWVVFEHKEFDEIKLIVSWDNLLIYVDSNKRFDIHTNASELQLEGVIIQDRKSITLCSRKLTVIH